MTEHDLNDIDHARSVRTPDDGERPKQKRRDKRDVHGWVVLDKPVGMTSTHAVSVVKRLFSAKRCGVAKAETRRRRPSSSVYSPRIASRNSA